MREGKGGGKGGEGGGGKVGEGGGGFSHKICFTIE